jgi:hypothetical protein
MQENLNIAVFINQRYGRHTYPSGSQLGGLVAEPTISSLHKGHPTNSQDYLTVYQIKSQLKKVFLRNYIVIEMYTLPLDSLHITCRAPCLSAARAPCYPHALLPAACTASTLAPPLRPHPAASAPCCCTHHSRTQVPVLVCHRCALLLHLDRGEPR